MYCKLTEIFLFIFLQSAKAEKTTVSISVYYETRCPDSKKFAVEQLKPAARKLGNSIKSIDFVPFGKVEVCWSL